MKKYSEKNIIKLFMLVLFLALMIIYILFYHIKGKTLNITKYKDSIKSGQENTKIINSTKNDTDIPQMIQISNTGTKTNSINTKDKTTNDTGNQFTKKIDYLPSSMNINKNTGDIITINTGNIDTKYISLNNNITNLSGTILYHGPIESIERLGITYKYALKDNKDIYYIYLGNNNYNFANIIRGLNGNLYNINTEQELIQNNLFGDKVTYINIPEYKDKIVIMLIKIHNEQWLIQISYNIYHESKKYLKSVFSPIL